MAIEEIDSRLTNFGVKPTAVRLLTLKELEKAGHPISSLELESRLDTVDRSSITRTLSLFLKHGLIHPISDGSGSVKYEPCHGDTTHHHTDEHAHFHCEKCGMTVCLEHEIPEVTLPPGFHAHSASFVITGTCSRCSGSTDE